MIDLSPLENISSIGESLFIVNNDSLVSLSGLENIAPASIIDLNIYNNPLLSFCEVASICDYLQSPNGTIDIHDNAPGCNSPEEVEEACEAVSVDEIRLENNYSIFPNPLNSTTLIQYILHQNSPVILRIIDLSGREIVTLVNKFQQQGEQRVVFNSEGLQPGIYFCVLKTKEGMETKKIVKL